MIIKEEIPKSNTISKEIYDLIDLLLKKIDILILLLISK